MILINLAIGLLTMMMCLIVQVMFTFWSVRYVVRHADEPAPAGHCSRVPAADGDGDHDARQFSADHAVGRPVLVARRVH
ncbi:MAG: hypothetical protein V5B44_25575 [Candidatus Accumulibacter necessarius]|uniref:hypothetical protein n=1 Tax=Candidatus Accumulibacter necessarius TaxID=2954386 RepID=UPI002FC31099